ncbi:cofilin [Orbilia oligospora]|uniref:Cofilin n=1 Tax=Orbilia oligospora TaxID=2813651 RepID=A0A7C8JJ62_ORBOL|nr:cofilin [Orbilia oligospora]KAF3081016.1 cofilin [Orbilia oligospora]KAF3112389.1 cofilin [Orbilia oligospora]KAF3119869.1 cofilin [Orbilia oligospora]KAF3123104.1 cofilin [Orbilia oligospora]
MQSYQGPPSACNGLSGDAIPLFNRLQSEHSPKYIIYNIPADTKLISVLKSSQTRNYSEFLSELPDNECRYGVYSFGDDQNDTIFINWIPDGAGIMERELYVECALELWREMMGLRPVARFEVREKSAVAEEDVRKKIAFSG